MASKKAAIAPADGITLSREDAKQILAFFDSVASADRLFKSCQSDAWRTFVSRNANAPLCAGARRTLRALLEASDV